MKKKIAAFFDIDGTIFRDSLMVVHFQKMIEFKIIDISKWRNQLEISQNVWRNRRSDYDEYLEDMTNAYVESLKGASYADIMFTARHVIQNHADEVYRFTRNRIKEHQENGHLVIFISGSPDFLVRHMAKVWKASEYRGSKYKFTNGVFTGEITPMWDSISKQNAINELVEKYNINLENSFAYGDTNGDFTMLKSVGQPYAINPARELFERIKEDDELKTKANIIIERKDVIYRLNPSVDICQFKI